MTPTTLRALRLLGLGLAILGSALLLLRVPLENAGWPPALPAGATGAFVLLAGLILLLVPGARRPV